jgi:hypothetical protein
VGNCGINNKGRGVSEETGVRAFGLGHSAYTRQMPLHTIRDDIHVRVVWGGCAMQICDNEVNCAVRTGCIKSRTSHGIEVQ